MDVFLSLPVELTRSLVIDWLRLVDLVVQDTAYCNKVKREQWEKVLRSAEQFQNYNVPRGKLFDSYQAWMLAKKIAAKSLVLKAGADQALYAGYWEVVGEFVEEVAFQNFADAGELESMVKLVGMHCDHIIGFTCTSCELGSGLIDLLYKSSLVHLRVENCTERETECSAVINWEAPHYITLRSVRLGCKDSRWFVSSMLRLLDPNIVQHFSIMIDASVSDELLTGLLPRCSNLRALGFSKSQFLLCDEYFMSLTQLCPNLLHLDISDCHSLTAGIAEVFNQNMASLRTVNINSTLLTDEFLEKALVGSHSLQALYANNCFFMEYGIDNIVTYCFQLRTLECTRNFLRDNENLNDITTLILWDDYQYSSIWMRRNCTDLRSLRLVCFDTLASDIDFMSMTRKRLPRLRTLSVCCEEEQEEPESLRELRAARPTLRVFYNTDVLVYDLLKLPV